MRRLEADFDPSRAALEALASFDPYGAMLEQLSKVDPHDALHAAVERLEDLKPAQLLADTLTKADFTLGLADLPRYEGWAYHYTTRNALEAIVESKTFHASEATSTNDLSEIKLGWTWIEAWLSQQPDDDALQLLRDSMPEHRGADGVFVLCATEVDDDAHQWRAYGGDAMGCAIGIDCSAELLPTAPTPAADRLFTRLDLSLVTPWRRVMYEEGTVRASLDSLLASVRDGGYAHEPPDEERHELYTAMVRSRLATLLTTIAHLVKHQGFASEREVRLVATKLSDDQVCRHGPSGGLRLYTELGSPSESRSKRPRSAPRPPSRPLPIVSVTLGPRLAPSTDLDHQATLTARLQDFLREHELTRAEARASGVPLR